MAKDQRLYGKFTLNFPRHPKIAILSDAAFRCLVEATLYSRDELTDGFLASRYAVARWGVSVLEELCQNDDEKPSLGVVEKGWQIHDYAEHQDTKDEVAARSARNKANGQKGGIAKGKRGAKPAASESVSEDLAETETETETKDVTTDVVTSPSGKPKRSKRTRVNEEFMPPVRVVDAIREEIPGITDVQLRYQHRKFIDHFQKTGALMADWNAAWRNWMRTANERGDFCVRSTGSAVDDKVNGWMDLATQQPPLLRAINE